MEHQSEYDHTSLDCVARFLLRRLGEVGVRHIFGAAIHHNVNLIHLLDDFLSMSWVSCCNELNASYAACGYACTGGVTALLTTCSAGEFSALVAVAGAYMEHVPVIVLSTAPPTGGLNRDTFLHSGGGDAPMVWARRSNIVYSRLSAQNAVVEIDRCLQLCILERRPVYFQIPVDVADAKVTTPKGPLSISFHSDPDILDVFTGLAIAMLRRSSHCVALVGSDIDRFGLTQDVANLVSALNIPVAVLEGARGVIDETLPQFVGVYAQHLCSPEAQIAVNNADCVLILGCRSIKLAEGQVSLTAKATDQVFVSDWFSKAGDEDFIGICLKDVVHRLAAGLIGDWRNEGQILKQNMVSLPAANSDASPLTSKRFWHRMESFLRPDDVIVIEANPTLQGFAETPLPSAVKVIVQPTSEVAGFSLPATFGSLEAAPSRRHLLFITPSSLQVTVQELSSIFHHELKPIIFLMEAPEGKEHETEQRPMQVPAWRYAELGRAFSSGDSSTFWSVSTIAELQSVLATAAKLESCSLVQVRLSD